MHYIEHVSLSGLNKRYNKRYKRHHLMRRVSEHIQNAFQMQWTSWKIFSIAACVHNGWRSMSLCYNRCLLPEKETSEVDLRRQSLQDNRKDFSGVQGCKNLKIFVRLMNFHKSKVQWDPRLDQLHKVQEPMRSRNSRK